MRETRRSRMATLMAVAGICAAALVLAGCGNASEIQSEPPTGQHKPTPDTTPSNEIAADRKAYERTAFHSPTGNIGCQISPTSVRCDIDQRTWSPPPRPADCTLDYGQGISIATGGSAQFVCAGDTARVLPPYGGAGEPLPYGQAITAGPIRCESAETGVTCRDGDFGHGFSISREAYELF
nr:DUF6636 domain-containing protein [Mycolicibacterium malmesburyense]CRL74114.1 hypothetical protein CPGR_02991 [Mycolicibacterium malmesburyense]